MHATQGHEAPSLLGAKAGRQSCPSQSIPAGEIERFVVEQFKDFGRDPLLVAETVHHTPRRRKSDFTSSRPRNAASLGHRSDMEKLIGQLGAANPVGIATVLSADVQDRVQWPERRLSEPGTERQRSG